MHIFTSSQYRKSDSNFYIWSLYCKEADKVNGLVQVCSISIFALEIP